MKKDAYKKETNVKKLEGKYVLLNKSIGTEYTCMFLYVLEYYIGLLMKTP